MPENTQKSSLPCTQDASNHGQTKKKWKTSEIGVFEAIRLHDS